MIDQSRVHFPQMRERDGLVSWAEHRVRSAPLFSRLHLAVAEDKELLDLALQAADGQLCGRMLLSAIHYLLLQDPSEPLAAFFPTISREPLPASKAAPLLKPFCRRHWEAIVGILRARTLQTTDADRSVQLLFALDEVAKTIRTPFSIVEVGCSAGLLLMFDQYRYDFGDGTTFGRSDSPVTVSKFEFAGDRPALPQRFPEISRRVGLDLNPVDVADPAERTWILACVVADFVDQFEKLRRALDYRATVQLETIAGDAMVTLPKALNSIAGPVCVFHSRCLYQWSLDAQDAFSSLLRELSWHRPLHRISIEGGIARAGESRSLVTIKHSTYDHGLVSTRLLGEVRNKDQIRWVAPDH